VSQEMPYIRSFSATLTKETAPRIAELLRAVFTQRCTCITIIKSIDRDPEVQTSREARPQREGAELVEVDERQGGGVVIRWSIGDYSTWIEESETNPVRVAWNGTQVTIRHNAPAGHPLVWIYAPEAPRRADLRPYQKELIRLATLEGKGGTDVN
jgi:hypothetical protein